jgi:MoaA/NifB/PqqE/SkfB family radical SAM enzyme
MGINFAYEYLKQARELGALSVKFNLRGEPLLYKYSLELLVYKAKILGYVDVMINTNGVLLNRERIMSLYSAGLTTCVISVDSFEKKTYDKIHGSAGKKDYAQLMKNLNDIANLLWTGIIKMKVKMNFHINEYNKDEQFKDSAFYRYLINTMTPVFKYTEQREGKNISIKRDKKRKRMCPHLMRRFTILSNGKVFPCCLSYNEPKDLHLAGNLEVALKRKKILIDRYRKNILPNSCKYCTSGDLYK